MLPKAKKDWTIEEAAHLARRAGFGASPAELAEIHAMGREAAVDRLLEPDESAEAFPLPAWAEPATARAEQQERFEQLREMRRASRDLSPEAAERKRRQFARQRRRQDQQRTIESGNWWFDRLLRTRAPLREKMVIFWHDHFATSVQKVRLPVLMLWQNERFREHAFGDFRALTHAMLRDPAMMVYLDTQTSKKGKPNENFAREVMELFTLGEGNYGEEDVREAARAFTGYALNRRTGRVDHNRRQWDPGPKTIFGRSGDFDGDGVIDLLFEQPAAAEYLPTKLWQYFVADEVAPVVVRHLSETFRRSGFRIEPVLREMFLSNLFYDPTIRRNQIKSPVQFLVQMCRELELDSLPRGYALVAQQQLGQVLFRPPNVAGWDWGKGWINTNTLLSRYNIAGFVTKGAEGPSMDGGEDEAMMMEMVRSAGAGGGMAARGMVRSARDWVGPDYEALAPRPLREDPARLVDALIARLFQEDPGRKQREAFVDFATEQKGAVFTNHEVAELCHLMMSTPHYQLA